MNSDAQLAEGEVSFVYEKGTYFRVVHTDGVVGGIAPGTELIHMSVFNERHPIPRKSVYTVVGGRIGPELVDKREVRQEVFREVEVDLVFSLQTAIALRGWLDDRISEATILRELQNRGASQ